jgi:hypothetical protein
MIVGISPAIVAALTGKRIRDLVYRTLRHSRHLEHFQAKWTPIRVKKMR